MNIDIDDESLATVMPRCGPGTKQDAVDLALRRLVGQELTTEFLVGLRGIGWESDLEAMRASGPEIAH